MTNDLRAQQDKILNKFLSQVYEDSCDENRVVRAVVKREVFEELESSLLQLFAAHTAQLKAELLGALPENPWSNNRIAYEDMPIGKQRRLKAQQYGFRTAKVQITHIINETFKEK